MSNFVTRYEFGLIADRSEVQDRCQAMCDEFGYRIRIWQSLQEYYESPSSCRVVLAATRADVSPNGAAESAQLIKSCDVDAFFVCVIEKPLKEDQLGFIRRSGAGMILLDEELTRTSKLEFACTQVINAKYLPIKVVDLRADTELAFNVFHMLPLRKKFLQCAFAGQHLDGAKREKLSEIGEYYIERSDADHFREYVEANVDKSAAGLASRTRAHYLGLIAAYNEFIINVTDRSGYATFGSGESLLKKLREIVGAMAVCLGTTGDAWEIVNQSSVGTFGSVDRAPAVAAYAGLFGLELDLPNLEDVMFAALLADLGLIFLSPEVSRAIRDGLWEAMTEEMLKGYRRYPETSVSVVLERKLPLEERLRGIVTSVQERADGSGFPKGRSGTLIPVESQLIQLASLLDRETTLKLGRARPDWHRVRLELLRRELENGGRFSPVFLERLKSLS